jgi:ubiquinone/menaquinone biosynthesis C-methylase UbiE
VTNPTGRDAEARRIEDYYATRVERPMSPTVRFVVDERRAQLARVVERFVGRPVSELRMCDVGCGDGGDLAFWRERGVPETQLCGTELLGGPLTSARERLPNADLRLVDGFQLPFDDRSFDVVYASMVLSSILDDAARQTLFREMQRVAASGGVVAVYDFRIRKPGNRNVVAMTRSRIRALGPRSDVMRPLTPLLPVLPVILQMPPTLGHRLVQLIPRTHALWVWRC